MLAWVGGARLGTAHPMTKPWRGDRTLLVVLSSLRGFAFMIGPWVPLLPTLANIVVLGT